ncbi:hypothetical protein ACFCX4_32835 [Kitasatospora sp. NPDC056327]|uniref:hypothetical protein n=1 Tax=Kitasatospora sp. NPDC056327 TaxID=3345785 RepID=UPI0035E291F3
MSLTPPSPGNNPGPSPDSNSSVAAPTSPPRTSALRRARQWFGGLSEAGKIALVTAVVTTIGGGVFGVVSATLSGGPGGTTGAQAPPGAASGGVATPGGSPSPRDKADTPDSGAPPVNGASCAVRQSFLYCTFARAGVVLYADRDYATRKTHTVAAGESLRFSCWGPGRAHAGGGTIWYWTDTPNQGFTGNVAAVDLDLGSDPAPGLNECPYS